MYLQRFFVEGLAHASFFFGDNAVMRGVRTAAEIACTVRGLPVGPPSVSADVRSPKDVNGN